MSGWHDDSFRLPGPSGEDLAERLSATGSSPDFSSAILCRVGQERPFACGRVQRVRRWVRVGVGAAGIGGACVLAIAAIWMPEIMPWSRDVQRPVTRLMSDAGESARASMRAIREVPGRIERLAVGVPAAQPVQVAEGAEPSVAAAMMDKTVPVFSALSDSPSIRLAASIDWARPGVAKGSVAGEGALAQVAGMLRRAEQSVGRGVGGGRGVVGGGGENHLLFGGDGGAWSGPAFGQPMNGPQ